MPTSVELAEVRALMEQGARVVEVLPAEEYAEEHLPGAISLPLKTLTRATAGVLPRDRPIVLYCYDLA